MRTLFLLSASIQPDQRPKQAAHIVLKPGEGKPTVRNRILNLPGEGIVRASGGDPSVAGDCHLRDIGGIVARPVGHHKAPEAAFLIQKSLNQFRVAGGEKTVDRIVGSRAIQFTM